MNNLSLECCFKIWTVHWSSAFNIFSVICLKRKKKQKMGFIQLTYFEVTLCQNQNNFLINPSLMLSFILSFIPVKKTRFKKEKKLFILVSHIFVQFFKIIFLIHFYKKQNKNWHHFVSIFFYYFYWFHKKETKTSMILVQFLLFSFSLHTHIKETDTIFFVQF